MKKEMQHTKIWKPKYKEIKEKAEGISLDYVELIKEMSSKDAIDFISTKYGIHRLSVYRYIKVTGTKTK